jgi:putative SOS response-associated peptidase YedK
MNCKQASITHRGSVNSSRPSRRSSHTQYCPLGAYSRLGQGQAVGDKIINDRGETATTLNRFREPFKKRHAIIPANFFYECMNECMNGRRSVGQLLGLDHPTSCAG